MNKMLFLMSLGFLTTLVSCDDVASNRKTAIPRNETNTPSIEGDQFIRSSIIREKGGPVLSYIDEINETLKGTLSATRYRIVPNMEIDDEGTDGVNIITRSSLGRPNVICGVDGVFQNISARILDCAKKNTDKALWSGTDNGNSGEGDWSLVALTSKGKEIWIDIRTRMLWSDVIISETASAFNWCKASGNDQNSSTTAALDCNTLAAGQSLCNDMVMAEIGPQVKWRLPTRNDFLQADLNGFRFSLDHPATAYWTATMKANVVGRTQAWTYLARSGILGVSELSNNRSVRCIGAADL